MTKSDVRRASDLMRLINDAKMLNIDGPVIFSMSRALQPGMIRIDDFRSQITKERAAGIVDVLTEAWKVELQELGVVEG